MRVLSAFFGFCLLLHLGCAPSPATISVSSEENSQQNQVAKIIQSPSDNGDNNTIPLESGVIPPLDLGGSNASLFIQSDHKNTSSTDLTKNRFLHDSRAHFHAHGSEVCKSGCALSNHPTETLQDDEFQVLLKQYSKQPMSQESPALEKLLYYGPQTRQMLQKYGHHPLSDRRTAFLLRELSKTHALVSFRIVDEQGIVRVWLPPTRVPLDRRHEFHMEVKDLPPLITSGTIKRVGLNHLWGRL